MVVCRGPNWHHGTQDKSIQGYIETIWSNDNCNIGVRWHDGTSNSYRYHPDIQEIMPVLDEIDKYYNSNGILDAISQLALGA
jgi:hypothetical protein